MFVNLKFTYSCNPNTNGLSFAALTETGRWILSSQHASRMAGSVNVEIKCYFNAFLSEGKDLFMYNVS